LKTFIEICLLKSVHFGRFFFRPFKAIDRGYNNGEGFFYIILLKHSKKPITKFFPSMLAETVPGGEDDEK
jgi:hypothetical protein